jgi:hypothetical protein
LQPPAPHSVCRRFGHWRLMPVGRNCCRDIGVRNARLHCRRRNFRGRQGTSNTAFSQARGQILHYACMCCPICADHRPVIFFVQCTEHGKKQHGRRTRRCVSCFGPTRRGRCEKASSLTNTGKNHCPRSSPRSRHRLVLHKYTFRIGQAQPTGSNEGAPTFEKRAAENSALQVSPHPHTHLAPPTPNPAAP